MTIPPNILATFAPMERLSVIAFTHNNLQLNELGKFHLDPSAIAKRMLELKSSCDLAEVMYLSTCNRVEFVLVEKITGQTNEVDQFIRHFQPTMTDAEIEFFASKARKWSGINAVNHLIEVTSSLDSMVLGEREIITQVREAYEFATKHALSGDCIRIVIRHCIETAKKIYTKSDIAKNPVSVVSLACKQLLDKLTNTKARIVVVGAGTTNITLCQLLMDEGFRNFTIYNREIKNAQLLAERTGGRAFVLKNLSQHTGGFDALLTCTAASNHIITPQLFKQLLGKDTDTKIVVDLAVPADVSEAVLKKYSLHYISVSSVKETSDKNLAIRKKELIAVRQLIYEALEDFKQIFKLRRVEIQMRELPLKVGEIRTRAVEQVFAKDIQRMDPEARATLEKVLNYMEKKYVSVPMLVAKQLVDNNNQKE